MTRAQLIQDLPWLVSRASAILAMTLLSASVTMGLLMAAKLIRRPALKRALVRLHEHVALVALAAIAVHGLALLGDSWLKPGWRGITIPFWISYRPVFTGIGIIGGYLAVLVGPSFYLRRRIGARRWRKLHRVMVGVWVLSVVHALGAGSDGKQAWLRAVVLAPAVPIAYLLAARLAGSIRTETRRGRPRVVGERGQRRLPIGRISGGAATLAPTALDGRCAGGRNREHRPSRVVDDRV
jgi:sulfoxide reductase heme-binding subunit YedZ